RPSGWPCPPACCGPTASPSSWAPPATTGTSSPSLFSAYLLCQKSSSKCTTGISSKFHSGGGEAVAHSSVLASHGSPAALTFLRLLCTTLYMKTRTDTAIMNAPTVETMFQKFHPANGEYV